MNSPAASQFAQAKCEYHAGLKLKVEDESDEDDGADNNKNFFSFSILSPREKARGNSELVT